MKQPSITSSGTLGITGADWQEGGVRGIEIIDIADNSSAQLAGMHARDVIIQINSKNVGSVQELASVLAQIGPGIRVSIGYLVRTNLGWMPKETAAILSKQD